MQKNAMISVKEAASLLDLDERSIRERLINGSLKGEKRMQGQRDKWFVSAAAIEVELKQKKSSQTVSELLNNLNSQEAMGPMNFNPGQQQAFPHPPGKPEPNAVQQGYYSRPGYQTPPENFSRPEQQGSQSAAQGQPITMQTDLKMEAGSVGVFHAHVGSQHAQPASASVNTEGLDSANNDVVDAVLSGTGGGEISSLLNSEALRQVTEAIVKPLTERMTEQLQIKDKQLQDASYRLGYLESRLQEQEEQIKLLPDYQLRADEALRLKVQVEVEKEETKLAKEIADEERQRAALKALEVESLKKQILALEEEQALALANERRIAEELATEMERLKADRIAEAKALSLRLEKLEQPWWKKLFGLSRE